MVLIKHSFLEQNLDYNNKQQQSDTLFAPVQECGIQYLDTS